MDDYDIKPNGRVNRGLHWTTKVSEKFLLAIIGGLTMIAAGEQIWMMYEKWTVQLGDLFLLFIYAEAGAIAVLAAAAYLMSLKDKLSLEKERLRDDK